MPESRTERTICLAGVVALGLLIALILPEWHERAYSHAADPESPTAELARGGSAAESGGHSESRVSEERLALAGTAHTLRLTAARGACWLHVESPSGHILYTGTLPFGQSQTFRGTHFRVRVGAGQNLAAAFDGVPVTELPAGTATVAVELGNVSVLEVG